jgi:hypothetical protein
MVNPAQVNTINDSATRDATGLRVDISNTRSRREPVMRETAIQTPARNSSGFNTVKPQPERR